MPLQRAQSETTSTEFVRWIKYLVQRKKDDLTTHRKEDYYFAQIAQMIHNSVSKSPILIERKLIDFELKKEKIKVKKPITREEATRISKEFWCTATGWKK